MLVAIDREARINLVVADLYRRGKVPHVDQSRMIDGILHVAVCPVCGAPVANDTLASFCGHDGNALRKCAA